MSSTHGPNFNGQNITVMGLGRFGGGVGVTRYLAAHGAHILLTDKEPADKLADSIAQIQDLVDSGQVKLRLGEHRVEDFTGFNGRTHLVVANPAIPTPWTNPYLLAARAARVPVTTEISLLISALPNRDRVIGITGTAGKSTTSAMTHAILETIAPDAVLAGNIGGSLLPSVHKLTSSTPIVLELSSAMLYWINDERRASNLALWSPKVAVVTNIGDNHADWHGNAQHYSSSKKELLAAQLPGDTAILGESVRNWPTQPGVKSTVLTQTDAITDLSIPGAHNALNAAMAVHAACALVPTLSRESAIAAARSFPGLIHRLQFVAEVKGVRFYNDSKCTTPEASLLAIKSFDDTARPRIHLIAGGYDKHSDLTPVAQLASDIAGLYTVGKTATAIEARANGKAIHCGTIDQAVSHAAMRAKPGDIVLLSPACASWDQYDNYEKRGEHFVSLVRSLPQ